jgi:hypothetical protein
MTSITICDSSTGNADPAAALTDDTQDGISESIPSLPSPVQTVQAKKSKGSMLDKPVKQNGSKRTPT